MCLVWGFVSSEVPFLKVNTSKRVFKIFFIMSKLKCLYSVWFDALNLTDILLLAVSGKLTLLTEIKDWKHLPVCN